MRIGLIGGGQLGMMLAEAAFKLNHSVFVLEPSKNPPIAQTKAIIIANNYDDPHGLALLDSLTDVIIYEFENIDVNCLRPYVKKMPQGIKALEVSQDRILEKKFAQSLGIPTAKFIAVDSNDQLKNAFYPSVLKTTRLGYDGKGQHVLSSVNDTLRLTIKQPMILEEWILFDDEISVVLTRDMYNNTVYLPPIKNQHKNGILDTSYPLWNIDESLKKEAYDYAKKIIESLDYVGTMAVEFFVKDQHVIFNEMAPRPHNSGHFSIEGSSVSQFENMILSITKKSVIEPLMTQKSLMLNVLGQHIHYFENAKKMPFVYIHDYKKQPAKENRKMGHITCLADLDDTFYELEKIIRGELHD